MSEQSSSLLHDPHVKGWTEEQFAPWTGQPLRVGGTIEAIEHLNKTQLVVYRFRIKDGEVSVLDKPGADKSPENTIARVLDLRADLYKEILTAAIHTHGIDVDVELAIDVGDGAAENLMVPLFTFQKPRGSRNVLIPDMESVGCGYYETGFEDDIAFADKACVAGFFGSTTGGGLLTVENMERAPFPRLRAATFFQDCDDIDFRLTRIVQCADEQATEWLKARGYGHGMTDLKLAFVNKFAISLDGNGAACSRPAITLRSNCTVMKYESENILYYSSSLIPWVHFLPIREDADVVRLVEQERHDPGRFAYVAEAGREFGMRYLGRDCVLAYTASLLRRYSGLFARTTIGVGFTP